MPNSHDEKCSGSCPPVMAYFRLRGNVSSEVFVEVGPVEFAMEEAHTGR